MQKFDCIIDLKILQTDWLRAFWSTSKETDFSKKWDLCMNTANTINFHYKTNSEKVNDKIFQ